MQGLLWSPSINAPALWGKVPSHADYVSFRVASNEAHQWQQWLYSHGAAERRVAGTRGTYCSEVLGLDEQIIRHIPVTFLIPPGQLGFSRRHYVVGVFAWSVDRLGREHPLIAYQMASPAWVRSWRQTTRTPESDWLFQLARLLLLSSQRLRDRAAVSGQDDWAGLQQELDRLWTRFCPKGLARLLPLSGQAARKVSGPVRKSVTDGLANMSHEGRRSPPGERSQPSAQANTVHDVAGVAVFPWNWLETSLAVSRPQAIYWQQDLAGRYVGVSKNLSQIWSPT